MKPGCGSPLEIEPGDRELLCEQKSRHGVCVTSEAEIDVRRDEPWESARTTDAPKRWFCFFCGDAGPMAVSVESVAGVLETHTLVRLPWSPPRVVGLCSYHREVVPVVVLGNARKNVADGLSTKPGRAGATDLTPAQPGFERLGRSSVLIMKTEHGAWGIPVEPERTFMSQDSPEYLPGRMDSDGPAVIGSVQRAGTCYGLLDAEVTWRDLRSRIVGWFGLLSEAEP
jgi:hypothetical protein